ncbi:hypothetical protein BDY24DRAFT_240555 [Mrakia frigida]|uniref:uncharacterized protein n=1 Tax=Mrakia frigida TaxID=29902 RepID=UPI003FCBFF96
MSFMDNVDRLELSLIRVKEVSSKTASPSGPFTMSFSSPFSSIIREAEPGEREIFRYVGPKSTPQQTHAPPSSSHQALFELNPPKPSTPLRPSTTSRGVVTDPEILLGAALKLVDGYRPMPRKRKLIVSLFEKYEGLKDSIMALEEAVETVRPLLSALFPSIVFSRSELLISDADISPLSFAIPSVRRVSTDPIGRSFRRRLGRRACSSSTSSFSRAWPLHSRANA